MAIHSVLMEHSLEVLVEEVLVEEAMRAAEVVQAAEAVVEEAEAVWAVGVVGEEVHVAELLMDRGRRGIRMRPMGIDPSPPPFRPPSLIC